MRILWTLPYLPWPTTSGGKTREYHLLHNLAARGHRITLLVQSKAALDDAARDALEPWLERLIVVPRRPLRSLRTLLAVVFAHPPMLASVNGFSPTLQDQFETLLQEPWDVIQIQHSYAFQPFEAPLRQSGKPFILVEHNIESGLGAASYLGFPGWARPFVRFDQWRYRQWEKRIFPQTRQLVAVTEDDAKGLTRMTSRATRLVVNGVDCDYYAQVNPDRYSRRLLFIGNYEYGPNVDAVQWALEQIMPKVWQIDPMVRLTIGGYALPHSWPQRWADPRIDWLGYIPDLRTVQKEAAIFFAPLREGGGSKLKVLEAMAAGLTVVTTEQGSSGLQVINGTHYLGCDDAQGLARMLAEAIEQPARLAGIGEAGRAYVRQYHDWSVSAAQLESIYSQLHKQEDTHVCA
ncbi:glycosyltransferase family 4 protein [Pseudomonas sp. LP_7_YM]|uniref:glycosyltransferase family 4 protein n=1 Tax=Pseudomonas sp. LP_7_YM TaxID=2485137 RepID=UPI0010620202|nr:glycosyltransferase family 4 protein [Pseudomonas sp. LP_7_YM]TDV72111.1 glycosyltransferase involved in cell wall biosynthesis [Pseudomonas sp. LP_7_YM]